ncbi:MAG: ATPase associated with various cellular 5 [Frankiales bacterium]|nr:ATPase associated with various cellular 5 [Frankiales bacterium]
MASLAQTTVLLDAAAEAGVPVLLIGGAGIGKSSKLRALAAARGIHQEIITASVHDPADFNGFPHLKDGAFEFEPPAWARRAAAAGTCRIVFDEINTAPHTVQAALLRVILEGVVGPLTLPGAQFIAAMNPVDIAVGGWELPPPMANRFLHVHVEPDLAEFIDGLLAQPRTSLLPSALTPVAITTAWDTTRWLIRTLQLVASRNTYGNAMCSNVRVRQIATSASSCAQILLTSLLLIPVPPIAITRSSTRRVETPST